MKVWVVYSEYGVIYGVFTKEENAKKCYYDNWKYNTRILYEQVNIDDVTHH